MAPPQHSCQATCLFPSDQRSRWNATRRDCKMSIYVQSSQMKSIFHCLNIQWIWVFEQMWCNDENYMAHSYWCRIFGGDKNSIMFPQIFIRSTYWRMCDLLGFVRQMFVSSSEISTSCYYFLLTETTERQSEVHLCFCLCWRSLRRWGRLSGVCSWCVSLADGWALPRPAVSQAEWTVPASREHDWSASKGRALCNDNKARASLVFGCWDSRAGVFRQWVSQSTV